MAEVEALAGAEVLRREEQGSGAEEGL